MVAHDYNPSIGEERVPEFKASLGYMALQAVRSEPVGEAST